MKDKDFETLCSMILKLNDNMGDSIKDVYGLISKLADHVCALEDRIKELEGETK